MKTITLILFCLTFSASVVCASDFHLVVTQLHGDPDTGTPSERPVYVFLFPREGGGISPAVYKTFDRKDMALTIRNMVHFGVLAKGDILHFDCGPTFRLPPGDEITAFTDDCKKEGITVVITASA